MVSAGYQTPDRPSIVGLVLARSDAYHRRDMPNLDLEEKTALSNFRRIAIGTWQHAYDPSVYGSMAVEMTEAMRYIAAYRAKNGKRLTVSHMVAKAAAMALKEVPDANAVLRWNRVYLRREIGVFFQVAMTDEGSDKIDLSGATLYGVDGMTLAEIIGCGDRLILGIERTLRRRTHLPIHTRQPHPHAHARMYGLKKDVICKR